MVQVREALVAAGHNDAVVAATGLAINPLFPASKLAWVLQNPNVSSAIMGATKPAQIKDNVKASGVKLPPEVMKAIDGAIGKVAERDPKKNVSPNPRP